MYKFKRIANLRIDNDLTQIKLAEKLNIKANTYSKWEKGINNMPIDYLTKLANFYNVSIDYILELIDNKSIASSNYISSKDFPEKLKKLRKKLNLSQEEFSKKIGISQRTYSYMERGARKINISDIYMIAHSNNLSANKLLTK